MQLVFVRHGERERCGIDEIRQPLTAAAVQKAAALREALAERSIKPRYILTSRYEHARQTAECLRVDRTRAIVEVTGLTPGTDEALFSLPSIFHEASREGIGWEHDGVVMLVGHEERLSNLVRTLSGEPLERCLHHLEAFVVNVTATIQRIAPPMALQTTERGDA
jgi:phosphohistidine phosphatase SixA